MPADVPEEFPCSHCTEVFPSQKALSGHIGGTTKVIGSYTDVTHHGDRSDYQKHLRLGEEPCVLCSRANSRYIRNSRAKARLKARRGY